MVKKKQAHILWVRLKTVKIVDLVGQGLLQMIEDKKAENQRIFQAKVDWMLELIGNGVKQRHLEETARIVEIREEAKKIVDTVGQGLVQ